MWYNDFMTVEAFIKKYNFIPKIDNVYEQILYDMNLGLFEDKSKAGQDMFNTWILPPKNKPKNKKIIVIDAGGTNFRSCLITFDEKGDVTISDFRKTSMPGIEKELSKKEFFSTIADNIDYLKDKATEIGFCFSYAMNMTENGDGIPNAFSKEIKAPQVIGCLVGENLKTELESRQWKTIKKIRLLNDTVAALLAGVSTAEKNYSSYIGFIFGTGINGAYIQKKKNKIEEQIIVCESGKCDKIPLSEIDISLDKKTNIPGQYPLEKCCSGGYLGMVGYELIQFAIKNSLFSLETTLRLNEIKELSLIEINEFLCDTTNLNNPLSKSCVTEEDKCKLFKLLDSAIERAAIYGASILMAILIQCDEGKSKDRPICILCNGTTLFKTHSLLPRIKNYLDAETKKYNIHYELSWCENDILLGTAIAGAVD